MTEEQNRFVELQQLWKHHPLKMQEMLWPNIRFYDKQIDMIYSVRDNKETIAVAGNMLGKDFVAGFIALWYFITNDFVRVITTSVKDDHLRILWDEIDKYVRMSAVPLRAEDGGLLLYNHHDIRKIYGSAEGVSQSYLKGMVSAKGEGLSGHHAKYTLLMVDEASGVEQVTYDHGSEWADKKFIFGNPNPCNNFFYKGVKSGDLQLNGDDYYVRKIIKITAEDSPNVIIGKKQRAAGQPIKRILAGVLPYPEYMLRRETWDPIMQCIKLDAEFYEGAEVRMFPPEWLAGAQAFAETLDPTRHGTALGIDTAEGGDDTVWTRADHLGLIDFVSMTTPDTSIIGGRTIAMKQEHGISDDKVMFDRGGGGKEHADYLRAKGHKVKDVFFGEAATPLPVRHMEEWHKKQLDKREKFTYKNRRAQMYHILRQLIKPRPDGKGDLTVQYGIPAKFVELLRQLAPIPLLYDEEGRVYLLPKKKKPTTSKQSMIQSLEELIGCSPDEADSAVMATYVLDGVSGKRKLGAALF